jgi:hypothetical protein
MFALISFKISDLQRGLRFSRGYVKASNGVSKIEKKKKRKKLFPNN